MPYDPDKQAPAEVYVDNIRIPVFNIETHIRKDGVLNINKLSDVHFPAEWNGVDYTEIVQPLNEDKESPYSKVEIKIRNEVTGDLETTHAGFVKGVGQGANGQLERRMRVAGLEAFLPSIPVSKRFDGVSTAKDVLEFVISELQSAQPIATDIKLAGTPDDDDAVIFQDDTEGGLVPFLFGEKIVTPEIFTNNRNTLIDVVNWLTEVMNTKVWFEYDDQFHDFILRYEKRGDERQYSAEHLGGGIRITDNNCLNQISPYNSITVNGRSKESKYSIGGHSLLLPSDQYPQATVAHPQLVKMSGGKYLKPSPQDVSAITKDTAVEQATSLLKGVINDSGGGEIVTRPSPSLRPYHTLESRPACNSVIDTDVPIITYEIDEITHTIGTDDPHQTELFCSMHVDPSDIEVELSIMKDA